MEILKEERIRLTAEGYRKICGLVDERASPRGYPRCEWCGKSVGRFHHHHIRFRSAYGSDTLENLIFLCENCHAIYAHGTNERKFKLLFQDCRMAIPPIKGWNERHKKEAQAIYKQYRRKK